MSKKVFNFSAGPAVLPQSALREAQENLLDYKGVGFSLLEMSHRSKDFDAVIKSAEARIRRLINISDDYTVLFLQGGASTQFATIPMNFLTKNDSADFISTGVWSQKAIKEAQGIGNVNIVASSEDKNFSYIPDLNNVKFNSDAKYVHTTSNNTIYGTQISKFPETGNIPHICDMSSDIMCRPFDMNKFKFVYAGAQKNIGPAGATLVIIHKDMIEKGSKDIPIFFQYRTHSKEPSLYNTPTTFAIYMIDLTMRWLEEEVGGLEKMHDLNKKKANILYDKIDSTDFYKGAAEKDSRSLMNITFTLPNADLDAKFIKEATELGLSGLKGHRSVGGCRASVYNAHPIEGVQTLVDFMDKFEKNNK